MSEQQTERQRQEQPQLNEQINEQLNEQPQAQSQSEKQMQAKRRKRVAVFFGGRSSEHEISVITGIYAANLLRGAGYEVLPVYLPVAGGMLLMKSLRDVGEFSDGTPSGLAVEWTDGGLRPVRGMFRRPIAVDCALNCCHGGMGEGGELAALLEWYAIPSASPAMAESAVFLDKALTKLVLRGLGIPTARFVVCREGDRDALARVEAELRFPVILKPSKLGSSVGISLANTAEEFERALAFAFRLDGTVLAEEYLAGKRDLNIAAYRRGREVILSPVEEVFSAAPILTFGEKYEGTGERSSELPAKLPAGTAEALGEYLRRIYEAFGMRGVVRADFLLVGEQIYFNELNTVPGTLATYLFGESLHTAKELLVTLVEEARLAEKKEIVSSGILKRNLFGVKGGKRGRGNG